MKTYKNIKLAIYVTIGVAIIVLRDIFLNYAAFVVGACVLLYGLDMIIQSLIKKNTFKKTTPLPLGITNIIIGVILFLSHGNVTTICVAWAIWSILREGVESQEAIGHKAKNIVTFINIGESIVVIVLSTIMAIEPSLHHIHFHLLILGIEQILEVLFPIFDSFVAKHEKAKQKATRNEESQKEINQEEKQS